MNARISFAQMTPTQLMKTNVNWPEPLKFRAVYQRLIYAKVVMCKYKAPSQNIDHKLNKILYFGN